VDVGEESNGTEVFNSCEEKADEAFLNGKKSDVRLAFHSSWVLSTLQSSDHIFLLTLVHFTSSRNWL
jgi:hypothetical protein